MKLEKMDLATRMKGYEKANERYLTKRVPVLLRLDGCHFHTFAKDLKKPFDDILIKAMQETTKYLCENIQGCVLGYTQSDEITLVLIDYKKLTSSAWFDNRQNKIESVAASMATMAFNKAFETNAYASTWINEIGYEEVPADVQWYCEALTRAINKGAYFDCRAFNIPESDVANNLFWRQQDASKNSIQALGQSYFSQKELQHKSCNDIQDMLMNDKGINWNDLPTHKKRGSCVVRNKIIIETFSDGRQIVQLRDETKQEKSWIIDEEIPIFKGEGREYIKSLI